MHILSQNLDQFHNLSRSCRFIIKTEFHKNHIKIPKFIKVGFVMKTVLSGIHFYQGLTCQTSKETAKK